MKTKYIITDTYTNEVLASSYEYNDDLGLQWALRCLHILNRNGQGPAKCTLWSRDKTGYRRIQNFVNRQNRG